MFMPRSAWRAALLATVMTAAVAGTASAAVSELTLDRTAQLSPGRLHATLTGTVTCDAGTTSFLNGQIVQPGNTSGFGSVAVACVGTPQKYAIDVSTSGPGVFKPGKASADVSSFDCVPPDFECTRTFIDAKITLKR
jgi:hypothetical protein